MIKCSVCGDYYSEHRSKVEFELINDGNKYDYFEKRHICADCAQLAMDKLRGKAHFEVCGDCGKLFNYAQHEKWFQAQGRRRPYSYYCGDKIRCYPCMIKWLKTDLDDKNAVPDVLKAKVHRRRSGSRQGRVWHIDSARCPESPIEIKLSKILWPSPARAGR